MMSSTGARKNPKASWRFRLMMSDSPTNRNIIRCKLTYHRLDMFPNTVIIIAPEHNSLSPRFRVQFLQV